MMKGIQLKEEMSTWLWDLPNYFKIKENPDYEEKLINLMLNGLRLFKNSSLNEITLSEFAQRILMGQSECRNWYDAELPEWVHRMAEYESN